MTEPVWLSNARVYLGTKEKPGPQSNQTIAQFYKDSGNAGVTDDAVPWCAAFVGAILKRSGIKGSGKLNARSYLDWGTKLDKPKLGCVVVFKRGNSLWQGHVAFFLREVGDRIEVLGGNQGDSVSIARYKKADLLGYRWPAAGAVAPRADDPGVDQPPVKKPLTPAQKGAGGVVAVGTGVAAAKQAGIPWSAIIVGLIVLGLVGFQAWYFRAELSRLFLKLKG